MDMTAESKQALPLLNCCSSILMVRPCNFGSNPETLADNAFQQSSNSQAEQEQIKAKAVEQFDRYVSQLRKEGVNVIVVQDTKQVIKPDAIFPNNWFTTHRNGNIVVYPMKPASRRPEKTNPVIEVLKQSGYFVKDIINLSSYEQEKLHDFNGAQVKTGRFLQGTGSMIFDHQNKKAYACRSERTDEVLFLKYCSQVIQYEPVSFTACDKNNVKYYHTNVIMSVCSDFIIICLEAIQKKQEKDQLIHSLQSSKGSKGQFKQIIEITRQQVNQFCGNVLEVCNQDGDKILTMSQTAYKSYGKDQLDIISKYCKILKVGIPCVQAYGGGGTRCMMAEIFLPRLQ